MPSAVVPFDTPIEFVHLAGDMRGRASRHRARNRWSAAASWSGRSARPCGSAMPASFIAAFTASATFSTMAGRPMSSGNSSTLIAVPMASRDFDAGPVLPLRANTVACGVITPSQPPDHTIGILRDLGFAALAVLDQHAAERLVGEDAGEVVDAAIAFGLADHGDDLVGGELPAGDARSRGRDASWTVFSSTFATSIAIRLKLCQILRMRGLASPRSIFVDSPAPRSIIARRSVACAAQARRAAVRSSAAASIAKSSASDQHHAIVVARALAAIPCPRSRRAAPAPARAPADRPSRRRRWSPRARSGPPAPARRRPGRRDRARSPSTSTVTQNGWPALPPLRP